MIMYATMKLDSDWDITIDADGNLATLSGGYATAQDVASACQVFLGECYYDTSLGIPYDTAIIGRQFTSQYMAQKLKTEALKITSVTQSTANVLYNKSLRRAVATVRVTDTDGSTVEVTL